MPKTNFWWFLGHFRPLLANKRPKKGLHKHFGHLVLKPMFCMTLLNWLTWKIDSKIQTSFNAKNHHHNQRHLGAPSIDFSWHIWIFGLPDSLGIFFINWKIFLNLFQKNLYFRKNIFSSDTALPKWLPVGQGNLTLTSLYSTIDYLLLVDDALSFYPSGAKIYSLKAMTHSRKKF